MDEKDTKETQTKEQCRGSCLLQSGTSENGYERDPKSTCDCKPVRCPNYIVCRAVDPQLILDIHRGTCVNCATMGVGSDKPIEKAIVIAVCTLLNKSADQITPAHLRSLVKLFR